MDALFVLLQQFCQRSQSGIDLLFAAAILFVEVHTAAGAKTLTVFGTKGLRVHIENERNSGQFCQIYFVVFQHNNVFVFLVLFFLGQNAREGHSLGIFEFLCAPGTDTVKRRLCLKFTMQYTCLMMHLAVHNNRMNDRVHTAKFQIGQIQLEVEVRLGTGGMQNSVYVQTHSTPRNDTSDIILNEIHVVKHFLTNILTFF